MVGQFLVWFIILFFLVRFTVNFLIPVFRATRKMKQQVRDFNDTRHEPSQKASEPRPKKAKAGEYIDFEEVK